MTKLVGGLPPRLCRISLFQSQISRCEIWHVTRISGPSKILTILRADDTLMEASTENEILQKLIFKMSSQEEAAEHSSDHRDSDDTSPVGLDQSKCPFQQPIGDFSSR